jgi:GH24 family phage-related lysozyme (muramidase)
MTATGKTVRRGIFNIWEASMRMTKEGNGLLTLYKSEFDTAESKKDAMKAVCLFVKCRLNDNQFSALICLVCGISIDTFRKSDLLKMLNRGNMLDAASEYLSFIYVTDDAGRRIIDEPTLKHRELQKDLFLKPEIVRRSKRSVCQG